MGREDVMATHRSADVEAHVDPDFDPIPEASKGEDERRRLRFRTRSMMLIVLVVGIWLALVLDPLVGPFVFGLMLVIGFVLAVALAAMSLGWLGFGLFALGDRVISWFQRSTRWPDS
jgi:hypothetical protein